MLAKSFSLPDKLSDMSEPTRWEYATVPLLTHATKQILDQWGEDGWELVSVLPGPTGRNAHYPIPLLVEEFRRFRQAARSHEP